MFITFQLYATILRRIIEILYMNHGEIFQIVSLNVMTKIINYYLKPFCSLLRETTQVWLLQLCLPSLTESGGIDGPRQFRALTSHTLVEKHGVF